MCLLATREELLAFCVVLSNCNCLQKPWHAVTAIASSSPCLQGKLAQPAVPWIIFQFALKCFSLTFTHALLRQNIWTSFDDKFEDHIVLASCQQLKTKQSATKRPAMWAATAVTAPVTAVTLSYSLAPLQPRCRLELLTGAKPLGRQRGAGRESLLKERQGKRVTEDLVMPLAAKYLDERWPKANASCVCVWLKKTGANACAKYIHTYMIIHITYRIIIYNMCVIRSIWFIHTYNVCVHVRVHIICTVLYVRLCTCRWSQQCIQGYYDCEWLRSILV